MQTAHDYIQQNKWKKRSVLHLLRSYYHHIHTEFTASYTNNSLLF